MTDELIYHLRSTPTCERYDYQNIKGRRDITITVLIVVCCRLSSVITEPCNGDDMSQRSSSIDIHDLQDIRTPFGVPLSGIYKKSFAYVTIKDRLPVILTKVIDTLSRNKEEIIQKYDQEAAEEIKQLVGFISKIKNEIVTNKTLKPLRLLENSTDNDADVWNKYLEKRTEIEGETPLWFNTAWLYCECYMYRSLAQEIVLLKSLNKYDPFEEQKKNGFITSLGSISVLGKYVVNLVHSKELSEAQRKQELVKLLKLNLWGNRCDLSLSAGAESSQSGDPIELLKTLEKDILVDDSEYIWNVLRKQSTNETDIVDIVLDNAGYELFTDLCLAAFLSAHGLAHKIRIYVKRFPWYVSDVTANDFQWTLEYMKNSTNSDLQELAKISYDFLNNNTWIIEDEAYWTGPYNYAEMKEHGKALYAKLSDAKLLIFKGDLNYRKLLGDINFEYTTSFIRALRGFRPTNILSLRTVKSDVCVGLPPCKAEELFQKDESWMVTGQYGLIQATVEADCQCSQK